MKERNRLLYFILLIFIVLIGLSTRILKRFVPIFITDPLGDALWAAMIYIGLCFLFNKCKTKYLTIFSLCFCYLIEFSQIYQSAWINSIRNTTLGGLVLGYGFSPYDLIYYTIGIALAVIIEKVTYVRK